MKDRNWKSLFWPTLFLVIMCLRFERKWEGTFFKFSFVFVVLWALATYLNFILKGKLSAWMEDESDLEVPSDFHQYCLKADVSPELKLYVNHVLNGGTTYDDDFNRLDEEVFIKTAEDAMALCAAFQNTKDQSQKMLLAELFEKPGSQQGFSAMFHLGTPLVQRYLEEHLGRGVEDAEDFEPMLLVRILAAYGAKDSYDLIESIARDSRFTDEYTWISVFGSINLKDKDTVGLISRFTKSLPSGFAGVAFLDWANEQKLEGDLVEHPFNTKSGAQRLREYLENQDTEKFSHAVSATAALPFVSHQQNDLLEMAGCHPDPHVRIESSWAAAKLGHETGLKRLSHLCLDWKLRSVAIRYLRELDREDMIPSEALEPRELAIGEAANWLKHPNELGEYPEQMEVFDHREMVWPPASEKITATLLRWKLGEDQGVIMVGSITWCFFSEDSDEALQIYGRHCTWELEHDDDFELNDDIDKTAYGIDLLQKANPGMDWKPIG